MHVHTHTSMCSYFITENGEQQHSEHFKAILPHQRKHSDQLHLTNHPYIVSKPEPTSNSYSATLGKFGKALSQCGSPLYLQLLLFLLYY